MFGEFVYPLHETAGYMKKTFTETQYKVKMTYFLFNSCVRIYLGDIEDWWMKDFGYIYCNVFTNSASLYCNGTCVRKEDGYHSW